MFVAFLNLFGHCCSELTKQFVIQSLMTKHDLGCLYITVATH